MTETDAETETGSSSQRLLRVDPRGADKRFELWEHDDGPRWQRLREDGSSRPCRPEDDRKLPLAQLLPELEASSDQLRLLAYRPGKRLVIRITEATGNERILKGYRPGRLAAAVQRHAWAGRALASSAVAAVSIVEVLGDASAVEFAIAPGGALDVSSANTESFQRIGVSLAQLQSAPPFEEAPRHDARQELKVLDDLSETMDRASIQRPAGFDELRSRLTLSNGVLNAELAPSHRDLHDGQFVADGPRLTLLDFDLACLADSALDVANLIAHLKLRELQGLNGADTQSFARCGQALLSGLDHSAQPHFEERLRFYQATTFLRLSLIYSLRPPWAQLAPDLLDMCQQ